jgi:hypothetical protein
MRPTARPLFSTAATMLLGAVSRPRALFPLAAHINRIDLDSTRATISTWPDPRHQASRPLFEPNHASIDVLLKSLENGKHLDSIPAIRI